jgi:DNA repair protein RadC
MEALTQSFHFNEVAEITLAYRQKIKASQRPKVTCSRQVYDVLLKFWNSDALEYLEQFQVYLVFAPSVPVEQQELLSILK